MNNCRVYRQVARPRASGDGRGERKEALIHRTAPQQMRQLFVHGPNAGFDPDAAWLLRRGIAYRSY